MAVQYFRAIDGLGRIVLPAELLHHLNWEKGKMSVSIEEKDGCLIVSSVPAAGRPPASPSPVKFQDSPDGQSKIILCRCLKNEKTAFLSSNKKAVFAVFALLGVGHPRWGDFEKSALKSPETLMNTEKNRGDIYFVTPSWSARRESNPRVQLGKLTFCH